MHLNLKIRKTKEIYELLKFNWNNMNLKKG